jgi:catechol 2,3-dioxygenase-like lactoylglutathione lyase family enzyme
MKKATTKFYYTGVLVENLDKSILFYTKHLQMKLIFRTKIKETGGEVAWLRSRGSSQLLELNWYPKDYPHKGDDPLDHLAFIVDDADESYKNLVEKSMALPALEPFDEGKWRLGYVKDPDGIWIELGSRIKKARRKRKS